MLTSHQVEVSACAQRQEEVCACRPAREHTGSDLLLPAPCTSSPQQKEAGAPGHTRAPELAADERRECRGLSQARSNSSAGKMACEVLSQFVFFAREPPLDLEDAKEPCSAADSIFLLKNRRL